ncbi:EF-hand domain-containing protein [Desulfovibrio sp. JY]|nr:EF-hand domain-containing protein [Desulfovibrio sp. JY]
MHPVSALAAAMIALSLVGAGCATRNEAPPQPMKTSYPSPDYPPQNDQITPTPAPRPPAGPIGRPLADQPRSKVAAPATRPAPAGTSPAPCPRAPDPSRLFSAMDKDKNGRVTLEEWRNFHENEFRRLDKNDDGVLTRDEMAAPPSPSSGGARPYAKPSPGPYPQ